MRERVTGSFVVVGPITSQGTFALREMLGASLELQETDVTLWPRPSKRSNQTNDGIAVVGTVEAEDEFAAVITFSRVLREILELIGWRLSVARLDMELVRVDRPARPPGVVDTMEYPPAKGAAA